MLRYNAQHLGIYICVSLLVSRWCACIHVCIYIHIYGSPLDSTWLSTMVNNAFHSFPHFRATFALYVFAQRCIFVMLINCYGISGRFEITGWFSTSVETETRHRKSQALLNIQHPYLFIQRSAWKYQLPFILNLNDTLCDNLFRCFF